MQGGETTPPAGGSEAAVGGTFWPTAEAVRVPGGPLVVVSPCQGARSAAFGLWAGAGSRHEAAGMAGIAHLVEHVVFRGTRRRPDSLEVARSVERLGGTLNAETDREYTGFFSRVPASHAETGLDVLWDLATAPLLRPIDLEAEKEVVIEEIANLRDNPGEYVFDLLAETLWPDQGLGRPVLGSVSTLSGLDRSDAASWVAERYRPEGMVVGAAGAVNPSDVARWIADRMTASDDEPSTPAAGFEPARAEQRMPRLRAVRASTEEAHLALALRTGPRAIPERWAVELLSSVLGEGMSGRLFQEVRERRRLAYHVDTEVWAFHDDGAFVVYAGVPPPKAAHATAVILRELGRLRDEPLSEAELRDAKAQFLGSLALRLEDPAELADWWGRAYLLDPSNRSPASVAEAVSRVTADAVRAAARAFFDDARLSLAAIGPAPNKRELERTLSFASI